LKELDKIKDKSLHLSSQPLQPLEIEPKPEGPELPPETHKHEALDSIELSTKSQRHRSRSIERIKEQSKSPRRSTSVSPHRKSYSRHSRSPKRRSRSRGRHSGSPVKTERTERTERSHKKKRERDRDRDRSRSKDKSNKDSKDRKKKRRDRDDSTDRSDRTKDTKVKRDYDEEEKGYDSTYEEKAAQKLRKVSLSPEDQ